MPVPMQMPMAFRFGPIQCQMSFALGSILSLSCQRAEDHQIQIQIAIAGGSDGQGAPSRGAVRLTAWSLESG